MLDGVEMFLRASNLSAAGRIPSCVSVWPKKLTLCCLNCSFSEFRLTLFALVASSMLTIAWWCSSSVEPKTMMSSAIPVTLGMFL